MRTCDLFLEDEDKEPTSRDYFSATSEKVEKIPTNYPNDLNIRDCYGCILRPNSPVCDSII